MTSPTPFIVTLSGRALHDLQELRDYIAREGSPPVAERYAARILAAIAKLERFPERGRLRGGVHELTIVPPYLIRYVVFGARVEVIRIRHGARRPRPSRVYR